MSRKRLLIVAGVVLVLSGVGVFAFLHLADWLIVQDPLAPANTIVVLSGQLPERALEAANLYRQKLAPQVWVSQPIGPGPALARMKIAFVGEDFYNQKVLIVNGVPADAIRIFERPIANTEEEVDEIARECQRDRAHTVIVVTSKSHTRRVRLIWRRRVGDDPRLIVRYATMDNFDAAHWWRLSSNALEVVREWLGMINAWLGFPARPAPHAS